MKARPRIVVIGSLVFDFVARAARLPRKGETILGEMFGMFPGGKGANQAVQAGRLGAEVFMVGRVGDDFLADRLLDSLQQNGVDTRFVKRDRSVKTAACCIHVDGQGNNAIVIVPEANQACSPEDVDAAAKVIRSADAVLCQLEIALPTVAYAVNFAAEHGIRVILNPAPAQQVPAGFFSRVSILTPNETEAEALTTVPSPLPLSAEGREVGVRGRATQSWEHEVGQKLLSLGPAMAIITLGERGAFFTDGKQQGLIPSSAVSVVDATAAGDAFNGALAVSLAEGYGIEAAIARANAAGALATTRAGAQPSLASKEEVEALLEHAAKSTSCENEQQLAQ
jgi:ribokinase